LQEQEAIIRLKQGDISGLEILVQKYQIQAVRAAYLITRDSALAEDIVQTAFIRASELIDQFDVGRPFASWFLRGDEDFTYTITFDNLGLSLEEVIKIAESIHP
jgi:DNA-directed RNA polymerase specialized sigma24 family protein